MGLIGGTIFLCLQQTATIPIMSIRLCLLAVPATYAAIGTFGFILESNFNDSPTENENYWWLVYLYPLLFLITLSITFSKWFFGIIFEVIMIGINYQTSKVMSSGKETIFSISKFIKNLLPK